MNTVKSELADFKNELADLMEKHGITEMEYYLDEYNRDADLTLWSNRGYLEIQGSTFTPNDFRTKYFRIVRL